MPIRAGVFDTEPEVAHAVEGLVSAGFERDAITVVAHDAKHRARARVDVRSLSSSGAHTPRAVPIGAGIGALTASLVLLISMSPMRGDGLIVAGALLAATIGGGLAGGYIAAMMTRGFEPAIADFHDQALEESQYLVAVQNRDSGPPMSAASAVLEREGVTPLSLRSD